MGTIIDALFAPRRTNQYRTEEKKKRFDMEVACGWFCCGVIMTAGWVLLIQIARWAWNHWW